MKCSKIATIPVNPRLPFGVRLAQVCENGNLHPGLRDLFLKAYLNTADDTITEDDLFDNYMQKALSFGPDGHGSLDERLLLKDYLEKGQFIISLKTPPGAPIWVIRHFLGRLPKPLLSEFNPRYTNTTRHSWLELAFECRNAVKMATTQGFCLEKLKMKLATILIQLENGNYLVLSALIGLIRNLGAGKRIPTTRLNKRVIYTLICYFSQALISRPFRPGLATEGDRQYYPLLLFLIYYWPDIRHIITKLNSSCLDEYLTIGKPRNCDSLPTCITLNGKNEKTTANHKKSLSLDNGRILLLSSSSQIKATTSTNSNSSQSNSIKIIKNNDSHHHHHQHRHRHHDKSQIESLSESHPLIYKCCKCQAVNEIEAKIYINVNMSHTTTDAVTQYDERIGLNSGELYVNDNNNNNNSNTIRSNSNYSVPSSSSCPCNIENGINLNASDSFEQNNMGFCLCSDNRNCYTEIPKNNFNTTINLKSENKNIDDSLYVKSQNDINNRGQQQQHHSQPSQHLDTLSEEDAELSSDNTTTSDYGSEGSSKKLLKKLNVSRLRSKLKIFSGKRQQPTRKSISDEFMNYSSQVRYQKIYKAKNNACSNL